MKVANLSRITQILIMLLNLIKQLTFYANLSVDASDMAILAADDVLRGKNKHTTVKFDQDFVFYTIMHIEDIISS